MQIDSYSNLTAHPKEYLEGYC